MAEEAQQPLTALDKKAEVVCAYIESAGNVSETIDRLKAKNIPIGRQAINSIIRTNPETVEWTKNFFTEAYTELCNNRLEAVSATGIQHSNETTLALLDKTRVLWFKELQRKIPSDAKGNPDAVITIDHREKLAAYQDFVKWNSISFINQNLVYSRFKDGLHAKQAPTVDQSQHLAQEVNIGEEVMGKELYGKLENYLAGKGGRFANIPTAEGGGNGARS